MPTEPRPARHARRTVLLAGFGLITGGAVAALTACDLSGDDAVVEPHEYEPALATARALVAQYEAAIEARAGDPELLEALKADHEAHIAELVKYIGADAPAPDASASASVPSAFTDLAALRTAEQTAYEQASELCVAALGGESARLIGSIAACRATHVEVLGD